MVRPIMRLHLASKTKYKLLFTRDTTNLKFFIIYFMSDNLQTPEKLHSCLAPVKNVECFKNPVLSKNDQPKQSMASEQENNFESGNDVNLQEMFGFEAPKEKPTNCSQKKKESSQSIYNFGEKKSFDFFGQPSKEEQFNFYPINAHDSESMDDNDRQIQTIQDVPHVQKEAVNVQNKKTQQNPLSSSVLSSLSQEILKDQFLILREIDPSQEQTKNTNFAKFVIKHFYKKFAKFNEFRDLSQKNPAWAQFNSEILQQISQDGGINRITLDHLITMFGKKHLQEERGHVKINRDLIRDMLRSKKFLDENVFFKAHIKSLKNKKQYLLATKIYALRCRSSWLTERMETK